jgi:hypothetical protein
MSQSQPTVPRSKLGLLWKTLLLLLLLAMGIAAFAVANFSESHDDQYPVPLILPVKLEIVYQEEAMLRGGNCVLYSGTATYTFRNEQSFPVTITFPPICHYTYSVTKSGWTIPPFSYSSSISSQETPFPDDKRLIPDFAKQQRDVVIPPGQSVDFTSPFNISCSPDGHPNLNHVFVFGLPSTPCSHPVVGTIYGTSVKHSGTPQDLTHTEARP